MRKRLFVAIELPAELRRAYREYASAERGRWPAARWTADDNLHVTVLFLGSVEDKAVPELVADLRRAVARSAPFPMGHECVCLAPPGRRPPTMIWSTFSGRGSFAALAGAVSAAARRHAPEMAADKEPLPHVTLARFKNATPARGRDVTQLPARPESFLVDGVKLIESQLMPSGPVYTTVENIYFSKD
jgi:RNA 2',3'-cyclic 3'-phosphodiesterase